MFESWEYVQYFLEVIVISDIARWVVFQQLHDNFQVLFVINLTVPVNQWNAQKYDDRVQLNLLLTGCLIEPH